MMYGKKLPHNMILYIILFLMTIIHINITQYTDVALFAVLCQILHQYWIILRDYGDAGNSKLK